MSLYPLVPPAPGVPALFRNASNAVGVVAGAVASITGSTMAVSTLAGGLLNPGQFITGDAVAEGTQILSQLSGVSGMAGSYLVSIPQTVQSAVLSAVNYLNPSPATTDTPSVAQAQPQAPQWGIFTSGGANVLNPDSVIALDDFMHEFTLSTFPIEEGSFGTYNKVAKPFEGRLIMNKGGSLSDRTAFLGTLETVVKDTNLYTLITPEQAYPNVNIPRYRLRRRFDQGFQLISVEVTFQEIRVAAAPAFSNTQDPTAQVSTTTGAVQAVTPTQAQVNQAIGTVSSSTGVGALVVGQPATGG